MQQLFRIFTGPAARRGSILVGVVALTTVMALAAVSYLQISGSLSRNESATLEDTKAFYAVETGLLTGVYRVSTWSQAQFLACNGPGLNNLPINLNGCRIDVSFQPLTNPTGVQVTAVTRSPINNTNIKKQMTVKTYSRFTDFAHLYGRGHPDNANDPTGLRWQGLGTTREFTGRFHMNERIRFRGYKYPYYNFSGGLASHSRGPDDAAYPDANYSTNAGNFNVPNINGYINNFDKGVEVTELTGQTALQVCQMLNDAFKDRFLADQPAVYVNPNLNTTIAATAGTITLPASTAPAGRTLGDDSTNYRPTLEFIGNGATGKVIYHYYNAAAVYKDTTYDNDGKIFRSTTDINVLGVVKGKTTVVTDNNKSIVIVADGNNTTLLRGNNYPGIVYADITYDFSYKNPRVSSDKNMLGLISGKYIAYHPTWVKWWSSSNKSTENIEARVSAYGNNLFINAVLCGTSESTVAPVYHGCIFTKYYCPYKLNNFGSSTFITYRSHWTNGNCYLYDERLAKGISHPGQPFVTLADGRLVLSHSNWVEKNIIVP